MAENTNECVIEWIPGRDYVGLTAKNGSTWKNRCEELEKEFPDDVKILARNNDGSIFAHLPYSYIKINPPRKYSDETNDIYRFLVEYFEKHGYMPSYEEIMDGTDLTKCTVQRHMRQLEMDSLIATEHPGISRAYRLTEYRYERKKHGKQIKDESAKEK